MPAIATDIGGIPEQIREGENGHLVPPNNFMVMAERIEGLVRNKVFRNEMGLRARKTAEERYDLNDQVKTYLDWYGEILERRN